MSRQKNKYWKHFKVVTKHKWYVFKECAACGIFWRGVLHDLSKFSPAEFVSSAKYFQGTRSPISAEKEELGYSYAWLHHKGHNKHHWEYWVDYDSEGKVVPAKIPAKYVVEMCCDWIGAGKAYTSEEWTPDSMWNYYWKVRPGRHFNLETEKVILELMSCLLEHGLDSFHKQCKALLKTGY